jgi:hypothetical protein
MKLTLSAGGGVTGLAKEHTIEVNSLDETTRAALIKYFDNSSGQSPRNFNETWSLDDEREVPIDFGKMNEELRRLYNEMKKRLGY